MHLAQCGLHYADGVWGPDGPSQPDARKRQSQKLEDILRCGSDDRCFQPGREGIYVLHCEGFGLRDLGGRVEMVCEFCTYTQSIGGIFWVCWRISSGDGLNLCVERTG